MSAPPSDSLPRKLTAVGVIGEVGASYTVYEKNWICDECSNENYARRQRCYRCRAKKVVKKDALVTKGASAVECKWREAFDPNTTQVYYYHTETMATQWERPAEMGAAPHNTGWFGRGSTSVTSSKAYEDNNKKYLARPARKQVEDIQTSSTHLEGANEYNIWYDKYLGDHWKNEKGREPAANRCVVARDAGRTRADDSKAKRTAFFCLHFARGGCAKGAQCTYLHHLPVLGDELRIGRMNDCFGRERHATDRDDMDGVGNFSKNSRTLYVAGLKLHEYKGAGKPLEKVLYAQFGEWGEVEHINIIHRLSICFVRFRFRMGAEFAKEAMSNQALEKDEVLNIRWAMDDPNPVAREAAARADHDAIVAIMKTKGVSTNDAAFEYPADYQLPEQPATKRLKMEGEAIAAYPHTDAPQDVTHNPHADELAALSYADPLPTTNDQ